jgi:thioredoxin-dependent peroxiredoxin
MTSIPPIGQAAPAFSALNQEGKLINLTDFAGQWLILYFYPKDSTPGCTTEATDFKGLAEEFATLGGIILGVSPDSEKSHCKFIEKHSLTFNLLSDPEHQVAEAYGAWGLKKFMGKEYLGILRSTFLIDPQGQLAFSWPKVKVKGHAEAVLVKLKELSAE